MLHEAAEPYLGGRASIVVKATPTEGAAGPDARLPEGVRRPGVIYGLENIIENAADFCKSRVEVSAEWDGQTVTVTVADDGPGFKPEIIDNLGEPYVTTAGRQPQGQAGQQDLRHGAWVLYRQDAARALRFAAASRKQGRARTGRRSFASRGRGRLSKPPWNCVITRAQRRRAAASLRDPAIRSLTHSSVSCGYFFDCAAFFSVR